MKLLSILLLTGLIAGGCSSASNPSTATPSTAVSHSTILNGQQYAEYVALASQYGYLFPQQIDGTEPVSLGNGTYQLAPVYLAKYQIMLQWKKEGAK